MTVFRIAARQTYREWRSGTLTTLALALVISAAALSSVGVFTERVERGLAQGANELLGGDLVLRSRNLPEATWTAEAQERNLESAQTVEFPSVAFSGDQSTLVQVKAVTKSYPLRGKLTISDTPFGATQETSEGPEAGTVWIAPRIAAQLNLVQGGQLELGNLNLRVDKIIRIEPDRGGGAFELAPRVLMHFDDLAESGLTGAGSRLRYQFLVAGAADDVDAFQDWLDDRRAPGQYFQTLADSQQQVQSAMERANQFLSLAALTAVILSGIAIAISVAQFAQRHYDSIAIMRCLGTTRRRAFAVFFWQLIILGIPALLLGALIGYGAQELLIQSMGDLIPETLPAPGARPALVAVVTGLIALLGFGLPPLSRLRDVPPVRVLNRQFGPASGRQFSRYLATVLFSVALVYVVSMDWKLTALMMGGLGLTLLALAICSMLVIAGLRKLSSRLPAAWRFGLANLSRNRGRNLIQIAGLGLGVMVLLLLGSVQNDLLAGWRSSLPEDTPNYFLINIQSNQVEGIQQQFDALQIQSDGIYPMATGKLTQINGETPNADDYADPRARYRIQGNINLSWADALPAANTIVSGSWWEPGTTEPKLSLAQSWAEALELSVGDTMTVDIGGQSITAEIANIREVDWDSFRVNFFVLLSAGQVDSAPRNYISSLFVAPDQTQLIPDIVREFPNVSVIDVGAILSRVRSIIDRVSLTVQWVFGFTLAAGLVVLLAALNSGLQERVYAGAILRTLGANRRQLRRMVTVEFFVMGLVAGSVAALAASIAGKVLASEIFSIDYQPDWLVFIVVAAAAGVIVALLGLWGGRSVLNSPPMLTLRAR